ncbi:MAG: hypothetical protein FD174_1611 [Geobacteraceae bacterium]|nr:MAG: hypothetical protein FD174_1611 [Geobacteraceae bacterium]
MQIRVIYLNGSAGIVDSSSLDYLINRREIAAFCRSDGWVRIGKDPTRKEKRPISRLGERARDIIFDDVG